MEETDKSTLSMEGDNMEINEPVTLVNPAINSHPPQTHTKPIPAKRKPQPKKKGVKKPNMNQYQNQINLKKKLEAALKQVTETMNEVKQLQEKIKSGEYNMKMEIEKPKFSMPDLGHPLNFIENLTTYLEKLPPFHRTVETAIDCLCGDAKNWANIYKHLWGNIDDFIKNFLEQYWGTAEQNLLRRQIVGGHWNRQFETMSRHFICLVSQAKWLPYQIPEQQLVYDLMRHYPKNVQMAWCVIKNKTILEATEFLRRMDDVELRFLGKKKLKLRPQYIIQTKREYVCTTTNMECVAGSGAVSKLNPSECIDLCNEG